MVRFALHLWQQDPEALCNSQCIHQEVYGIYLSHRGLKSLNSLRHPRVKVQLWVERPVNPFHWIEKTQVRRRLSNVSLPSNINVAAIERRKREERRDTESKENVWKIIAAIVEKNYRAQNLGNLTSVID